MKKALLLALLSVNVSVAAAAEYFVVVPFSKKTQATVPVQVSLASYTLPNAVVGSPYVGFDFKQLLSVTGDPAYNPQSASFSAMGLPPGFSLANTGELSGVPESAETKTFTVAATYKGKSGSTSYSIQIENPIYGIALQAGGYRTWSDGTLAATCSDYRNPTNGYTYSGATGDGIYRVNFQGTPTNVYCNMSWAGGGWMLAVRELGASTTTRSIGSMTVKGYALTTQGDESRPALPSGTVNNFSEGLVAGGSSAWKNLYGDWVKFSMRPYTTSAVSLTLPDVSSQTGKSELYLDRIGWGTTSLPPAYTFGAFWDANGVSPICGGSNVFRPKSCPSFSMYTQRSDGSKVNTATYGNHYDTTSIREFYVR